MEVFDHAASGNMMQDRNGLSTSGAMVYFPYRMPPHPITLLSHSFRLYWELISCCPNKSITSLLLETHTVTLLGLFLLYSFFFVLFCFVLFCFVQKIAMDYWESVNLCVCVWMLLRFLRTYWLDHFPLWTGFTVRGGVASYKKLWSRSV